METTKSETDGRRRYLPVLREDSVPHPSLLESLSGLATILVIILDTGSMVWRAGFTGLSRDHPCFGSASGVETGDVVPPD